VLVLVNPSRCRFLILCLLVACVLSIISCKKGKSSRKMLSQDYLKACAEKLRSRRPVDSNIYPEMFQRRKEAIDMLSNGVFDERVIILSARVAQSPSNDKPPRSVGNSPRLVLLLVDELKQVAHVSYSQPGDPNAFGDTLFGLCDYYSLFTQWPPQDLGPIHFWSLYLKGYDINQCYLLKHQSNVHGSRAVLEVPQSTFDSLMANRGQIIIYDSHFKALDRFVLRPPPENKQSNPPEKDSF
jgi:hypothetical protein